MTPSTYIIDLQNEQAKPDHPQQEDCERWIIPVFKHHAIEAAELTVRIVGQEEMTSLNEIYRKKTGPTNVLSFPFEGVFDDNQTPLLGDIVLCAPVVQQEALNQQKTLDAHYAHLMIHGTLHLLGYDHENAEEAANMEALEILFLSQLAYNNPYGEQPSHG